MSASSAADTALLGRVAEEKRLEEQRKLKQLHQEDAARRVEQENEQRRRLVANRHLPLPEPRQTNAKDLDVPRAEPAPLRELTGHLEVTILSARHLPKMDVLGTCDAVCKVRWLGHEFSTEVKKNTYSADWNETFSFPVGALASAGAGQQGAGGGFDSRFDLVVDIYDWNSVRSDKLLGGVRLPCETIQAFISHATSGGSTSSSFGPPVRCVHACSSACECACVLCVCVCMSVCVSVSVCVLKEMEDQKDAVPF